MSPTPMLRCLCLDSEVVAVGSCVCVRSASEGFSVVQSSVCSHIFDTRPIEQSKAGHGSGSQRRRLLPPQTREPLGSSLI